MTKIRRIEILLFSCNDLPHIPHDALQFSLTILFFSQYLGANFGHLALVSSQGSKINDFHQ